MIHCNAHSEIQFNNTNAYNKIRKKVFDICAIENGAVYLFDRLVLIGVMFTHILISGVSRKRTITQSRNLVPCE